MSMKRYFVRDRFFFIPPTSNISQITVCSRVHQKQMYDTSLANDPEQGTILSVSDNYKNLQLTDP